MLVPLLICKTALSAVLLSVNEAWKAVCEHRISTKPTKIHIRDGQKEPMAAISLQLTGSSRLITLKLSRQALICVTVLLYIYVVS